MWYTWHLFGCDTRCIKRLRESLYKENVGTGDEFRVDISGLYGIGKSKRAVTRLSHIQVTFNPWFSTEVLHVPFNIDLHKTQSVCENIAMAHFLLGFIIRSTKPCNCSQLEDIIRHHNLTSPKLEAQTCRVVRLDHRTIVNRHGNENTKLVIFVQLWYLDKKYHYRTDIYTTHLLAITLLI
jgi:hypothetical protein